MMTPLPERGTFRARASQRGVALVVVLMLLLAITGIVAFSARNASFGEIAARNQLDSEVARQAAESALRDAERDLLLTSGTVLPTNARCMRGESRPLQDNVSGFTPDCAGGQCDKKLETYPTTSWVDASTNAEPWWPPVKGGLWGNDPAQKPPTGSCTFTGGVPIGTYTGAPSIQGVALQPEYMVELMQRGTSTYFRITARGYGMSDRTQVVLQSYFWPFTVN
jgi:type IV pilus assembly protein PilX